MGPCYGVFPDAGHQEGRPKIKLCMFAGSVRSMFCHLVAWRVAMCLRI